MTEEQAAYGAAKAIPPEAYGGTIAMKTVDDLQREIVASIEELMGDPEEFSAYKTATVIIEKVRAYLVDEDAELPPNPYTEQAENFRHVHINELKLVELKEDVYSEGQQSVVDAGFRKVRGIGE